MGDDALTAHQRGFRTEISSFDRQPLDCEQCGNCIEVCPVGRAHRAALPLQGAALGPAPARHDLPVVLERLHRAPRGSAATEILRARGTEQRGVNQEYLCVRGRLRLRVREPRRPLSKRRYGAPAGSRWPPASFEEAVGVRSDAAPGDPPRTHGPGSGRVPGQARSTTSRSQYSVPEASPRGPRASARTHVDRAHALHRAGAGLGLLAATGGGRPGSSPSKS
jgi:NADH-quinone oxidoreductase subunit G